MSNNSDFEILTDRKHIILRPQMYIGSISSERYGFICNYVKKPLEVIPGLLKIINEIIDNAVDEAIRTKFKYANKIDVDIIHDPLTNEYRIEVTDNGRGIPLVKYNGVYQAQAAWTLAKAGTSFSDDRTTIGANGVGSFATNCFSKRFEGISGNGKEAIQVICEDSCNPDKIQVNHLKPTKFKRGTKVSFVPDLSMFGTTEISQDHFEVIKDRLVNLAICYPKIKFSFNQDPIKITSISKIAKNYHESAISFEYNNLSLVIAPSGEDETFECVSYVNGLNMKNGGSHIDYILSQVINELQPMIKRKWKISVLPNQIKQHLLLCLWCDGFNNPKFDSQSKEKLTNTVKEVKEFFDVIEFDKIAKKIIATDDIINPMIEAILYKKELAEKRKAKAALKKARKKKISKHLSASHSDFEKKILHIAEGESAMSSLLECRNAQIHGAYPLKGKILNTHNFNHSDILKNKELLELMSIIGLSLDSKLINEDPDKLYKVEYDNQEFIVAQNDVIITDSGEEVDVYTLLQENGVI